MLKQLLRLCFELVKRSPTSTVPAIPVRRPRRAMRRASSRVLVAAAELTSPAPDLGQAWLLPRSQRRLPLEPNIVTSPACQVALNIDVAVSAVAAAPAAGI